MTRDKLRSSGRRHSKTGWQHSPVDDGKPVPWPRWKEVSRTVEELAVLDIKGTWVERCKERMKRESEVLDMADELASVGKADEHTGAITMRGLKRLRKIRE